MTKVIHERFLAIGDLDFLNEENLILQDQLDHMAKIDPNGLEALRNGIEEALTKNTYSRDTRLVKNILICIRVHSGFEFQNGHLNQSTYKFEH